MVARILAVSLLTALSTAMVGMALFGGASDGAGIAFILGCVAAIVGAIAGAAREIATASREAPTDRAERS
jgi:hypothetical protein